MAYDIRGRRVYLSGPMTGLPDLNRRAFAAAVELCFALGAREVFNPCTAWGHTDHHHTWYMRHDLHRLTQTDFDGLSPYFDALVLLDGYEESDGAMLEQSVAASCGVACVGINELREAMQHAE